MNSRDTFWLSRCATRSRYHGLPRALPRALLHWHSPRASLHVQVPGQKVGLIAARRTGQIRGRKEVDDRDKK